MKTRNWKASGLVILACIAGFIIAKIDTSENWDDTGITVGLILISSFIFGAVSPRLAWLYAAIIGGPIFVFNVVQSNNYGSAVAILFSFVGAYSGFLFRRFILDSTSK